MQALLQAIAQAPITPEAGRVFHGRGGLHEGCEQWVLDRFPPVWLLTAFRPATEAELAAIGAALQRRMEQACAAPESPPETPPDPLNWVYQCRHEGRTETRLMAGSVPATHEVQEAGLRWRVQLLEGQNHGFFLDMAEGRRWVRAQAQAAAAAGKPLKVLNLFAYTCAFSVTALQGGARHVLNVDMNRRALATGQQNHQINGIAAGASFMAHDVFSSWGKITRSGPYGLVILDPPSFQKGSFVATKDYARLIRRLPDLLPPGGRALLCLNAPELGSEFLHQLVQTEAPEMQCVERLNNPAAFADAQPERALKVWVYQRRLRAPAGGPMLQPTPRSSA
jgi:23S rRNA (cytosine1962-C5)-methyltransferase